MKKFLLLVLTVFLFGEETRTVSVSATALLEEPADQIIWNVRIRTLGNDLADTKFEADKSRNMLFKILGQIKIPKENVEISPYRQGANYQYKKGQRVKDGFFTQYDVYFKMENLNQYDVLIEAFSYQENFEIISSNYGLSDFEQKNDEALKLAAEKARAKATLLCKTLGVKLGKVLQISDNSNFAGPTPKYNTLRANAESFSNTEGKVDIRRSVQVVFQIE